MSKQTTNGPTPLAIPNTNYANGPISANLTDATRRKSVSNVAFGTSMLQTDKSPVVTPVSDAAQAERDKRIAMRIKMDNCRFWSKVTASLLGVGVWIGLLTWGIVWHQQEAALDNAPVIIWKPVGGNISTNGTVSKPKPGPQETDCRFVYDAEYGNYARLEPPWTGKPYIGFNIDWAVDTPMALETRLKHRSSIVGAFLHIDNEKWEKGMLEWYAMTLKKQAQEAGRGVPASTLLVALMPDVALELIPLNLFEEFAEYCAIINYKYGVPLMIRFGHEMNGNWNPYGQRPIQFKKSWIQLTAMIRKNTNMTAMVWAPK
jgi:hypothetical protein